MRVSMRFAFLALMLAARPASAQFIITPHTAQALEYCYAGVAVYTAQSANAPANVAAVFADKGKVLGVRICKDADGNTHYFLRQPRTLTGDVCRVAEEEVFPATSQDIVMPASPAIEGGYYSLPGWTWRIPEDWDRLRYQRQNTTLAVVLPASGACPPPDDKRYIRVSATDGMLRTFFRKWRAMTASPEVFDAATAAIPQHTVMFPGLDQVQRRAYLRKLIFGQHEDIESVECENECQALVVVFAFVFDMTDHGLVITEIREYPLI
jgi:hypothetical protein